MDRKLDAGALLVAGAALLLVVSLFLDWFGLGEDGISAWRAFEVLDLVLLAAAVAAVAAAFGRLDSRVLLGAALVALVVVASQLIQPPPAGQGAEREVGAWLALVASLGLLAGAALTAAQIAVTVDVKGKERRRRVPAVDRRGGATPEPPRGAGAGAVRAPEPARTVETPAEDRFAPDSAVRVSPVTDPEATQAFPAVGPDDDPR